MESTSVVQEILQLLPLILVAGLSLWMGVRILRRAGYSGWWSLLMLTPLVNIAMIWVFAFSDWPALKARS